MNGFALHIEPPSYTILKRKRFAHMTALQMEKGLFWLSLTILLP